MITTCSRNIAAAGRLYENIALTWKKWARPDFSLVFVKNTQYSLQFKEKSNPNQVFLATAPVFRQPPRSRGFTLIELMIALVISLILLLVIGTAFTSSRQAFRMQEDNSRIQEAGRFALEILGRSIKQAGHAEIPFFGFRVMFSGTAIIGTNGVGPAADTLTVQYDGAVGDRDCIGGVITATMQIRNHFNIDTASAQLQCAGVRAVDIDGTVLAPGAPPAGQPLLENIEDLQVLYGIDATGDQSANQYVAAPVDWTQVVTARVCVLIRSNRTNIVAVGSSYLDCNGNVVVSGNRRLRRAFTGTFNLRNRVNILP